MTYAVQALTRGAVTVLGSQRLVSTQLIFHLSTMTFASPLDVEIVVVAMHFVWFTMFPFVFLAVRTVASL